MASQVVEITDRESGSSARVLASLGFNCFSWRPLLDDGPREMLWADPNFEAGNQRPSSGGIPLLFPFAGRISEANYRFEGRDYQLEPGDALGNAIHGFVFNRPWRIVEQGGSRVIGEFQASKDDRTILERWPSDFRIRVSYEVRARELLSEIHYENMGAGPLPCGFATHSYFRLPLAEGGRVADTIMTVPAEAFWELENMIPTGRILAVGAGQQLAKGLQLDDLQFDTVFTKLHPDADRFVRTSLRDPNSDRTLTQTFDDGFTQCVVYTPGHREAVCMEPYTCVPDAIRLTAQGHDTGLQILPPGEQRGSLVRLEVS